MNNVACCSGYGCESFADEDSICCACIRARFPAKLEVLAFSVQPEMPHASRCVIGSARICGDGAAGLSAADVAESGLYLGAEPVGGTITGALRQFNLPTARAPGDWPEPATYTVRY